MSSFQVMYFRNMKKYFVFLVCLMVFQACDKNGSTATTQAVVTVAEGAETVNSSEYELTSLEGADWKLAEKRNADGEVTTSGYVDAAGRKQGCWTNWKEGRSPTTLATYLDGKLNGAYQEMDAVGRVTKFAHYLEGQLHGRYAEYRAGIVQKTASYKKGQLHGVYREHTLQNGKVNRSIAYKNGQPDGPMRWFNDAGDMIQERMYRKGELVE